MKQPDPDIDRLLRSAAECDDGPSPVEMPFGFDTRVLALARENGARSNGSAELGRFVRRIGVIAFAVFAIATAGAYQQFATEADGVAEANETPLSEAYMIADNAIQTEFPGLAP